MIKKYIIYKYHTYYVLLNKLSITTIIGPMFSGKTTELIKLMNRHILAKQKCIVIKHKIDTRFVPLNVEEIRTHEGIIFNKCKVIYFDKLTDAEYTLVSGYNVVGIEEGFFFDNINEFCNRLANANIHTIVSSIESSYKQEPFMNILNLVSMSEKVIKLNGICMECNKNDSSFTISKVPIDDKFLVGSEDSYKAVCRKCLVKYNSR